MHVRTAVVAIAVALATASQPEPHITIHVDASARVGPMTPMWAMFGYDEPNYTYTANGKKLLDRARRGEPRAGLRARAQPADERRRHAGAEVGIDQRLHRRCRRAAALRLDDRRSHLRHLLRAQDEADRRDRLHARSALDASRSVSPSLEARRRTRRSTPAGPIRRRTTTKWRELVSSGRGTPSRRTARARWRAGDWEVWNEPDIGYWHGTPEEYQKLYDYAADGLKRVLPTARIGGPT